MPEAVSNTGYGSKTPLLNTFAAALGFDLGQFFGDHDFRSIGEAL